MSNDFWAWLTILIILLIIAGADAFGRWVKRMIDGPYWSDAEMDDWDGTTEEAEDLRTVIREEFDLSGPLLDAFAAEELPDGVWDDTLPRWSVDAPELSPEEEKKIRKIVSDTLADEKAGRVLPGSCQSNLKGLGGEVMFYCDKTADHSGFHQNLENEMTWVIGHPEDSE